MNNDIKPYAIISEEGKILAMLQTNEKGYRKSIENNQLWAVNPETGRLLPEDFKSAITGFHEKDGWYEAVVKDENSTEAEQPDKDGPAAQTSDASSAKNSNASIIDSLFKVIEQRKKDMPEGSYTTHLFNSGLSKIRKKTGEEAVELILAEERGEIVFEAADLIYHMLVLLAASEIQPSEIFKELESRE